MFQIEFHPYKIGLSIEGMCFPEDEFNLPVEMGSEETRPVTLGWAFYISVCLLFWDITFSFEK